jgi:PAS domain S-box-containing protein
MAVPVSTQPAWESDDVKLLIVDDEPRNLDALEVMLQSSGCSFVRAHSADEALLALLHDNFAAMILDIKMPGMGGIELAQLIKQRRRTQNVPILFLTAHLLDEDDVLRGYGVGAVDYLSKPINADILRSKVAVFLELFRKTRDLLALNDTLHYQISERAKAQLALQEANKELERRVAERTADLTVAHRGVRHNEERLRMAMDVAQIAAWEWDIHSGRMTWSSDPEALFGFPGGALGPEKRLFNVLHPDDRDRCEEALQHGLSVGTYECDYRVVRPDTTEVWVTERGRVLRGDDGAVEKMVGVSRDVSAQRKAERERERLLISERRARDEAERQSRIKDEFLATLSHELRTPMNAILGWLNMLATGKAVRDPVEAMAVIQRNAQMQAKLIEDLLEMNRLTSGTITLDLELVNLSAVTDAVIQSLRPTAETKGVYLSAMPQPAVPELWADPRRLQQILWNLVHNAVKFTAKGGQVQVEVACGEEFVEILVRDSGQGISPDFLPHVFDRFRQGDQSTTKGTSGLGIGLSIAKHLAELQGGSIAAASDGTGHGAIFVVQLPVRAAIRQQEGAARYG